MSRKTGYTNESLGDIEDIPDFLPSPGDLAFKEDTVKVNITLSRSSADFFKRIVRKHHTPYQKMIRRLPDAYPTRHDNSTSTSQRGR